MPKGQEQIKSTQRKAQIRISESPRFNAPAARLVAPIFLTSFLPTRGRLLNPRQSATIDFLILRSPSLRVSSMLLMPF
jgi:hypothetical protein